jgi:hypothetical protein
MTVERLRERPLTIKASTPSDWEIVLSPEVGSKIATIMPKASLRTYVYIPREGTYRLTFWYSTDAAAGTCPKTALVAGKSFETIVRVDSIPEY